MSWTSCSPAGKGRSYHQLVEAEHRHQDRYDDEGDHGAEPEDQCGFEQGQQALQLLFHARLERLGGFAEHRLELAGFLADRHELDRETRERAFGCQRRGQAAGTLSGGEQQMLAIGRALMSRPRLLLLDEPSLGLAPILVERIFTIIQALRRQGVTILLVEQNAYQALRVADRAYVLETGQVRLTGRAAELADDPQVQAAYLGG